MTSDVLHRSDGTRRDVERPPVIPGGGDRPALDVRTAAAMNAAISGLAERVAADAKRRMPVTRPAPLTDALAAAQPPDTARPSPFLADGGDPDATQPIVIGRHRADGTTDTVRRDTARGSTAWLVPGGRTRRGGWFARAIAVVTRRAPGADA